jgi:hypothetical protein
MAESLQDRLAKAWANHVFKKPTYDNIENPPRTKMLKGIVVKPTFKVFKVDMFIHKKDYKKYPVYKEAYQTNENNIGFHIINFWCLWIDRLCEERGCDAYELVVTAGMPRILQRIKNKQYFLLGKMSMAHRFASNLGEPFIPTFSEEELMCYKTPDYLHEKVEVIKTKRSLKPEQYGRFKFNKDGVNYLNYKKRLTIDRFNNYQKNR